jgi:hypothetical protein
MRKLSLGDLPGILATIALLALAGPAHAQGSVYCTNCSQEFSTIAKWGESIGISKEQLTNLTSLYSETIQVYNQAEGINKAVTKLVGADKWAPGLNNFRNPLPFAAPDHPGWAGGWNDPSSLPYGSQYVYSNTVGGDVSVYRDGSFTGAELQKAIYSLSTIQSLSTNNLSAIQSRIIGLTELFGQLSRLGVIQDSTSLTARLQSESNYAHQVRDQSLNLQTAAQQQLAVLDFNQRQYEWQDQTNGIAVTCQALANSDHPFQIPECVQRSTQTAGGQ